MELSRRTFVKFCGAAAGALGIGVYTNAGRAAAQDAAGNGAGGGGVSLPRPDRPLRGTAAMYAKDATYPPLKPLRPPAGAPNIAIILIDDMGFGATSAFGGPIHMPNLERVANEGLRYTRFHTCALCSPTRQALLTGRNHHSVEMGAITEQASSVPGYTSVRPNSAATIAEVLRMNGYSTGAFGKMHQTPVWEVSTSGPFDRWPTGEGFEKFYGFVGAETNQWAPTLVEGTTPVEPPDDPEYHFTADLVDHTIAWVQAQHALTPDKPFFVYLSFGATHAPHQAPPEWIEKYAGKFDAGWDQVREETLARQKELGVVGPDTELTTRSEGIPAWDELSDEEKQLALRLMETYAGFAEHTDYHAGRFIDALAEMGVLDNTLIFYIAGDNGASAEGGLSGVFNEMAALNNQMPGVAETLEHIDDIGTVMAYNHYPVGWAHAMDCPYQWTKQVASHWGGTRNGMAVRWPQGFATQGEVRHQFTHAIDIVPTILEATGLPAPDFVNGITQQPIEGISFAYSFDDGEAPEQHTTQYFEMFGNRGIYHNGWSAVTQHVIPFKPDTGDLDWNADKWELYDGSTDWSQAHDLAAEMPEKLAELQQIFLIEAAKYKVFPLDDRRNWRLNPELAGRPDLMGGRTSLTVYPGMVHLMENAVLNVKNKSHSVTAEVEAPEKGAEGVIIAQGGRFGGWSLYVKEGKPVYCHNWIGVEHYTVAGEEPLPAGPVTLRYEFAFDGGQPGAGGMGTLFVNGEQVAQGRIDNTVGYTFSLDEGMDVGMDLATPVSEEYGAKGNEFTGSIHSVTIDIGSDDLSHQLDPALVFSAMMAGQ